MITFEPYFKLKKVDLSTTSAVASGGGTDTIQLQPSTGYIYNIVAMDVYVPAPAGATANTHVMNVMWGNGSSTRLNYFQNSCNFGTAMYIGIYGLMIGDTEQPSGDGNQMDVVYGRMWANNTNPINFEYTNNTDANQTGTREYIFLVKEYKEAI